MNTSASPLVSCSIAVKSGPDVEELPKSSVRFMETSTAPRMYIARSNRMATRRVENGSRWLGSLRNTRTQLKS